MARRLRALYICYLSLDDPLVHTQVVAYLEGLATRGHVIHLLTFDPELAPERKLELTRLLEQKGITWHSRRYHKSPSLPATMYDTLSGALFSLRLIRRERLTAVHARNHVPAAMALVVRRLARVHMIFDIRGLMAEEYVDAGRWKRGGIPYRITTSIQTAALRRAEGVVMLTEAVKRYLLGTPPSRDAANVIPCCADLARIARQLPERDAVREELRLGQRPMMVYVGKFTGRYMEREMVDFFAVARAERPDLAFLVLTQSDPQAIRDEFERTGVDPADYRITSAPPERVGRYLAAADFGICFYQPKFCEIGASPTKVGEYLGAGLPVLASPGIGDLDELLKTHGLGVVIGSFDASAYRTAAGQMQALLTPELKERCKELAHDQFSLADVGIPRYHGLYEQVAAADVR